MPPADRVHSGLPAGTVEQPPASNSPTSRLLHSDEPPAPKPSPPLPRRSGSGPRFSGKVCLRRGHSVDDLEPAAQVGLRTAVVRRGPDLSPVREHQTPRNRGRSLPPAEEAVWICRQSFEGIPATVGIWWTSSPSSARLSCGWDDRTRLKAHGTRRGRYSHEAPAWPAIDGGRNARTSRLTSVFHASSPAGGRGSGATFGWW